MERIVALSDLHLGEGECTLDAETISAFTDELREIGDIDQLILLGDVLDLSMASFAETVDAAKSFLKQVGTLDEIKEIVFIPGNHDHHLWVQHIEDQGVISDIRNGRQLQKPDYIKEFRGEESFISGLLPPGAKAKLIVKYPNHSARVNNKEYFFHHGQHLSTEGTLLMTLEEALQKGVSLNEFELHNSPIHELIQYSLERSESMRHRMENAWSKGGSLSAILSVVDEMTDAKGWGIIIRFIYWWSLIRKKNKPRGSKITKRLLKDVRDYLELSEALRSHWFIFGHTHVPEGNREGDFNIVNTGSWFRSKDLVYNTYVVIDEDVVIRKLGESDPIWPKVV
jgi:predicted phosphodiesterase